MKCLACGKPITTTRANPRVISLARVWTHYSWWANLNHSAIPKDYV